MTEKRIVFVGEGSPLLRAVNAALSTPNLEIVSVLVPEEEVSFFEQKVSKSRKIAIDSVGHIERGRFHGYDSLKGCDYLLSFNNMHLIDHDVIRMFRFGGINYHAGSLPEYAGSYTFQWAIRNNETEFASTFHVMEGKTDAGPIIMKRSFPISSSDTGLSLLMKSVNAAVEMVAEILKDIAAGVALPRIDQDLSRRRFYSMRDILDSGRIDWSVEAEQIERLVRAADFSPLSSPTYTPYTETRLGIMQVLRSSIPADSIPDHSTQDRPGTVISVSDAGIEVRTGGNRSLMLTAVAIGGAKCQARNVLTLGIEQGDTFGPARL